MVVMEQSLNTDILILKYVEGGNFFFLMQKFFYLFLK